MNLDIFTILRNPLCIINKLSIIQIVFKVNIFVSQLFTMSSASNKEILDNMILMDKRSEKSQNEIQLSINKLTTSIENLTTSFRYSFEAIAILHETELQSNIPNFYSSVLTIEQNVVKEFIRPSRVNRNMAEAKVYLEKHKPITISGILFWEDYPSAKMSRNSKPINMESMTTYKYQNPGIWKRQKCDVHTEEKGHIHKVLVVVGFDGTIIVVDWNIGHIPIDHIDSAILLLENIF